MNRLPFVLLLSLFVSLLALGVASAQSKPEFRLGFRALADQIPDVIGESQEDEHWGANGDSLQQTTTGLMVWRKADNWTAFTNGSRTWINGPSGNQGRANDERFSWEGISREQAAELILALPEVKSMSDSARAQGYRLAVYLGSDPAPLARLGDSESRYTLILRGITQDTITRVDTFSVDPHNLDIYVDTLWGDTLNIEKARASGWRAELGTDPKPSPTPPLPPAPTATPTPIPPTATPDPDDAGLRTDIREMIQTLNGFADAEFYRTADAEFYRTKAVNSCGRLKARAQLGTTDLAAQVRELLPAIDQAITVRDRDSMRTLAVRLEKL